MTDLEELRNHWMSKYPHVMVTLWENYKGDKFHGLITSGDLCRDITAKTIGELIELGEEFLRKTR
jgi:hypothetical protein